MKAMKKMVKKATKAKPKKKKVALPKRGQRARKNKY